HLRCSRCGWFYQRSLSLSACCRVKRRFPRPSSCAFRVSPPVFAVPERTGTPAPGSHKPRRVIGKTSRFSPRGACVGWRGWFILFGMNRKVSLSLGCLCLLLAALFFSRAEAPKAEKTTKKPHTQAEVFSGLKSFYKKTAGTDGS